jgi:hypothetical protein
LSNLFSHLLLGVQALILHLQLHQLCLETFLIFKFMEDLLPLLISSSSLL